MKITVPWDSVIHTDKYFFAQGKKLGDEVRMEWTSLRNSGNFPGGLTESLLFSWRKWLGFEFYGHQLLNLASNMWGTSLPQKFHLLLEISLQENNYFQWAN